MPTYEAVAIGNNTNLRAEHTTKSASVGVFASGTKFHGDNPWVCPQNIYDEAGLLLQKQGDVWLQVVDANGSTKVGWVAVTHKGSQICTITPAVTPPPPPVATLPDLPYSYSFTIGEGSAYIQQPSLVPES
jgi:hypothetical protein